jgi:hypothetical protein
MTYPLSYRHVEEPRQEHGVSVEHVTINREGLRYSLQREEACYRRTRARPSMFCWQRCPNGALQRLHYSMRWPLRSQASHHRDALAVHV